MKQKEWQRAWIGGSAVIAFLILWEIAMPLGLVKVAEISRPSLVVKSFFELAAAARFFLILSLV